MVVVEDSTRTSGMSRTAGSAVAGHGTFRRPVRESSGTAAVSTWRALVNEGALALLVLVAIGTAIRLHYASFLDPFEDGYQNWWISANVVATGEYWDRHSMMTQGNWLPLYHLIGAATLAAAGLQNFAAMKFLNIVLSAATALLVFWVARKVSVMVAVAATMFFVLNFIDVVVSGWSTAESLAAFLVFLGYAVLFRRNDGSRAFLVIGGLALGLAVLARYEAWLVVVVVLMFAIMRVKDRVQRRGILIALVPALALMAGYLLYASQWGFLPQIVVDQTSTDLRFQLSVGTQRPPEDILASWWSGYFWLFAPVLVLGGAFAALRVREDVGAWIVFSLWGFIIAYVALRFGNPSYRYVMITVPFLSLFAAEALQAVVRRLSKVRALRPSSRRFLAPATMAVAAAFLAVAIVPPTATYWDSGFTSSSYMVPLQRAGEFVGGLPLPDGRILVSESSIAAFYSGYPPDRILGSRWLPNDRTEALTFLQDNAAFVVYVGVPYYALRTLFPELEGGASTEHFVFLYDAGGRAIGTHAVFVYEVVR